MTKADRKGCGAYDAPHDDLLEWTERVEGIGELLCVDGAEASPEKRERTRKKFGYLLGKL
jgi:hypothetical protein